MVKIDNLQPTQTNQTEASANQSSSTQTNQNNQTQTKPNSGLMTIIGQCLPFAPLVFEQFTGQKVPQLSGTMADIQTALQQLQLTQTQIVNNQQQIYREIEQLKTNASHQLTTLTQQFQSLRLTHTKEQKQIEYNPNQQLTNQE
jgi:hypothetical protein